MSATQALARRLVLSAFLAACSAEPGPIAQEPKPASSAEVGISLPSEPFELTSPMGMGTLRLQADGALSLDGRALGRLDATGGLHESGGQVLPAEPADWLVVRGERQLSPQDNGQVFWEAAEPLDPQELRLALVLAGIQARIAQRCDGPPLFERPAGGLVLMLNAKGADAPSRLQLFPNGAIVVNSEIKGWLEPSGCVKNRDGSLVLRWYSQGAFEFGPSPFNWQFLANRVVLQILDGRYQFVLQDDGWIVGGPSGERAVQFVDPPPPVSAEAFHLAVKLWISSDYTRCTAYQGINAAPCEPWN